MDWFPRWLMAVSVITLFALTLGGGWFYRVEEQRERYQAESTLQAIAQLKVNQIADWRADQLAEGDELMAASLYIARVARWLADEQSSTDDQILARFRTLEKHYRFRDILLVDSGARVRLSLTGRLEPLADVEADAVMQALQNRRSILTDLHRDSADEWPHIDVVAPLFIESGEMAGAVGAVILQNDVREFLYPLIQSWPTPSASAETMLVRRDGDSVLFLNESRYQPDTALTLRIPLSRTDAPSVMAVLGTKGIVLGKDYRGVAVLAALKAIPDSPWFMVAKTDETEVFAEWRFLSRLIVAMLIGIVGAAFGVVATVWQGGRKAHYKMLLKAETARLKTEELYRSLFENMLNGFAYCKMLYVDDRPKDFIYLEVNSAFEALTGLKNVNGKKVSEVIPGIQETDPELLEIYGRVARTATPERFELYVVALKMWFSISVYSPEKEYFVAVFDVITQRKHAEEALRKSEERFRGTLDSMMEGCQLIDFDWRYLYINDVAARQGRRSKADLAGRTMMEAYPGIETTKVFAAIQRCMKDRISIQMNNEFVFPDGDRGWFQLGIQPVPEGVFILSLDITERKRAEAERERLASAIEQAAEMVLITDANGTIEYVNPAFEVVTGYARAEVIGKNPRILKSGEQDDAFYREMWKTLSSGKTWSGRVVNKRKDGAFYTAMAVISPVRNADGTVVNYVAISRDLSHELQLEAQLLQSQKMESVGRLAGGVAHDFNNMLAVIMGHAELALERIDPGEPVHKDLREIEKAAQRSSDLTRQLLAFARRQTVIPKVLDLNDTVVGTIKMLKRLIGEDIDLAWLPGNDLWNVKVDPSQVNQVLTNLVVNARDAISGVGKITMETSNVVFDDAYCAEHAGFAPGQFVRLTASDTGVGMTKETIEHIFEPFFTTKELGKGTGLGLATVYGIIKQNNGFINVYSEPGQGTSFTIYFPRCENETDQSVSPALLQESTGGHETVLLVEDEEAVLDLGKRVLDRLGYTVLTAGSPHDAIRIAGEYAGTIHVLITDVIMPDMNGADLAAKLAAMKPGIKRVFMSGYTADAIAHQGVLDDAIHFVQKPFSVKDLADKVRAALDS